MRVLHPLQERPQQTLSNCNIVSYRNGFNCHFCNLGRVQSRARLQLSEQCVRPVERVSTIQYNL